MNKKNYVVETLNHEDFDEWVNHCGSIFDVGPAYFRRHFIADPHKDYNSVFIIKDDGQIISTVRVFQRQVYIDKKIYKMGGIGEVSTNPDYRRLGLSGKLLDAAIDYMKENDFRISSLGTGYFSHYAKHGFVQVNQYIKHVSGDFKYNGSGEHDIRPLNPSNFHDMSALYEVYSKELQLPVVRDKDYWKTWCAGEIKNPHGLFRNGRISGYICFEDNNVTELIAAKEDHDILLSAIIPHDNTISVPLFTHTKREIWETETHDDVMINLLREIEIDGTVYSTTEELVEYFNNNGGIVHWSQDSF